MTERVSICHEAGSAVPCRFAGTCHESRQRQQAGYLQLESGRWLQGRRPLEGEACWAFQQLMAREPKPDPVERSAIEQEGP